MPLHNDNMELNELREKLDVARTVLNIAIEDYAGVGSSDTWYKLRDALATINAKTVPPCKCGHPVESHGNGNWVCTQCKQLGATCNWYTAGQKGRE